VRDDPVRVADMRESLERIRGFVAGGRAAFFSDAKTHEAVAYEVLKLGEAAGHISVYFRRRHPEVPWKRLAALRNEIVHEYFRVDLESLWQFVEAEMGVLEDGLRGL